MTNTTNFDTIEPTNPLLTVAPSKEETEMLRATEKITALYCRLSRDDGMEGDSVPSQQKWTQKSIKKRNES